MSTDNNGTVEQQTPGNSTTEIDWSKVRLPDDHPLVKAYTAEKTTAKQLAERYKGVDPAKYQELVGLQEKLTKEQQEAETKRLESEGQYAALADQKVDAVKRDLEKQIQALQQEKDTTASERAAIAEENQTLKQKLTEINRQQTLRSELTTIGFNIGDQDALDLFMLRYGDQFEYDEKSGLTAKVGNKKVTASEALATIKQETADKNYWKSAVATNGSNTIPGSSPIGTITGGGKVETTKNPVIEIPKSVVRSGNRAEIAKYGIESKDLNKAILDGRVKEIDN